VINIKGTQKELVEIKFAKEDAQNDLIKWLQARGWTYTSNNNACLWLLEKKFKGDKRTLLMPANLALAFEEATFR